MRPARPRCEDAKMRRIGPAAFYRFWLKSALRGGVPSSGAACRSIGAAFQPAFRLFIFSLAAWSF
jgi:hypothetical protein